jgi:hypothetical protein
MVLGMEILDARKLMIDRRNVPDCVDFRPLSTEIRFAIEPDTEDPFKIHDWYWCLKGTRGYRHRVHPL